MIRSQFETEEDVKAILQSVATAAEAAQESLRSLSEAGEAIRLLEAIKFEKIGRHPLESDRTLNLIEQVNQTFTCLVTARALEYLFRHHPDSAPFRINAGTASGPDIESVDASIAAEVFAATHPGSNQKLKKDMAKVRASGAPIQYVFFYCPGNHFEQDRDGVRVVPLEL